MLCKLSIAFHGGWNVFVLPTASGYGRYTAETSPATINFPSSSFLGYKYYL
jgi:hypothetical protein